MNNIELDWLLPLEDDEQFVGGKNKKDINEDNPIGGTEHFEQKEEEE